MFGDVEEVKVWMGVAIITIIFNTFMCLSLLSFVCFFYSSGVFMMELTSKINER